jgi:hypothetical protein
MIKAANEASQPVRFHYWRYRSMEFDENAISIDQVKTRQVSFCNV